MLIKGTALHCLQGHEAAGLTLQQIRLAMAATAWSNSGAYSLQKKVSGSHMRCQECCCHLRASHARGIPQKARLHSHSGRADAEQGVRRRLVISDIDGTITKSDLLGHVLPRVGWDWCRPLNSSSHQRIPSQLQPARLHRDHTTLAVHAPIGVPRPCICLLRALWGPSLTDVDQARVERCATG